MLDENEEGDTQSKFQLDHCQEKEVMMGTGLEIDSLLEDGCDLVLEKGAVTPYTLYTDELG